MSATDAVNNPVRRGRRELHSDDTKIGQMDDLDVSFDADLDDRQRVVPADAAALQAEYDEAISFAEQPVKIMIAPAAERNAPQVVDCFCNGKGAEILVDRRWIEIRWLPVNRPIVTKIKYAEVLLRSKVTNVGNVMAQQGAMPGSPDSENKFPRSTTQKNMISVLGYRHPDVPEWLRRVTAEVE